MNRFRAAAFESLDVMNIKVDGPLLTLVLFYMQPHLIHYICVFVRAQCGYKILGCDLSKKLCGFVSSKRHLSMIPD